MTQVKAIKENVNPGDLPLYSIGKQVQWMYTELKDFVWMMGPLHIEMGFMTSIGLVRSGGKGFMKCLRLALSLGIWECWQIMLSA